MPSPSEHIGGSPFDATAWLAAFARAHGRPLRVLHIGNIANNAYRNAAIQRQRGIEADVVCYDYYHIMGCPEWEDAEINGTYDAFLPDWWRMDVGGTARPEWFIQGPLLLCLDYLRARHRRDDEAQIAARLALVRAYAAIIRAKPDAADLPSDVLSPAMLAATLRIAPELRALAAPPTVVVPTPLALAERFQRLLDHYANPTWHRALTDQTVSGLFDRALKRRNDGLQLGVSDRARLQVYALLKALRGRGGRPDRDPAPPGYWGQTNDNRNVVQLLGRYAAGTALATGLNVAASLRDRLRRRPDVATAEGAPDDAAPANLDRLYRDDYRAELAGEISGDIAAVRAMANLWRDLLPYYDIVQGYAFDASIPLFCGHPAFAAYEHGTIRLLPFEESRRGRLCRFTYKHTPRVFITNSDVLPSADRIPISRDRRIHLPHAFDDAKLKLFRASHPVTQRPAAPVRFFSPTRHHWKSGDGSWLKGNDIFLRAAGRVAAEGALLHIALIDWGQEVADSKALIEELGLSPYVSWSPIMNRTQLWTAYLDAHVVVDQFTLPALGGVGYESMTLGCRLMTSIDEPTLAAFFGEAPPLLNASTVDAAADRIRAAIADPLDAAGIGARARIWAETFHSTGRILDLQVKAYHDLLDRRTAASARS